MTPQQLKQELLNTILAMLKANEGNRLTHELIHGFIATLSERIQIEDTK